MARMKPLRIAALLIAAFVASAAWAQEKAFTNRSTDLKDSASSSGKTIVSLPGDTEVKVIARAGAWTRIEANGQQGFVNVFHLRFPATAEKTTSSNPLSGISGFFGGSKEQQKTTLATTGIRGLSPDDLKNSSPDAAALAKAESYRADKAAAERFAKDGKLQTASVDYAQGGQK
jgi:hypothetical protein